MNIPDELHLIGELVTVVGAAGIILLKLGRLGERFDNTNKNLEATMEKVDKIEEALSAIAVQKEAMQSIREQVIQNANRTDDTFKRIFSILDRFTSSNHASSRGQ